MIRKALYGPPNWLVDKFSAEDRRMFGFWVVVAAIITYPIFGRYVLYVSALSVVALIPNYTTETPVEAETADIEHADEVNVDKQSVRPSP